MAKRMTTTKGKAARIKEAAASVFMPTPEGEGRDRPSVPAAAAREPAPTTTAPAGRAKTGKREKRREEPQPFLPGFDPAVFLKGWENLWQDNVLLKDLLKSTVALWQGTMSAPPPSAAIPWRTFLDACDPAALFQSLEAIWKGNDATRQAWEYLVDACQRSVLFWDAMRRRGDDFLERVGEDGPPALGLPHETIVDGRTLDNPVDYVLLRIIPEDGLESDPHKRPLVIVDPWGGCGPEIGDGEHESPIDDATRAGHPVYFVMGVPDPEPGWPRDDAGQAEGLFLREIARRHPEAPRPCLMGDCRAGWSVASLANLEPELLGVVILNGAPLAYRIGHKNPWRYIGGLLGGKWLASLSRDLGNGRCDGSWLAAYLEALDPDYAYFRKEYDLYANVDREAERYLDLEKRRSGHFLMNAEAVDRIVTEWFVPLRHAEDGAVPPEGRRFGPRDIERPVVVLAGRGDDAGASSRPALDWIVAAYGTDQAILAEGKTVVYTLHPHANHPGFFVGASLAAARQRGEFVPALEAIVALPPGLYEMVVEKKNEFADHAAAGPVEFTVRFEMRSIAAIAARSDEDGHEDCLASVAEASAYNEKIYRTLLAPLAHLLTTERAAEFLRWLNPHRMKYYLFSERFNPVMASFRIGGDWARKNRRPVPAGNYFSSWERDMARSGEACLEACRRLWDNAQGRLFKTMCGPLGLPIFFPGPSAQAREGENADREAAVRRKVEELKSGMDQGGFDEALIRLVMAATIDDGVIDGRSFLIVARLEAQGPEDGIGRQRWRERIRDQRLMLLIDEDRAVASLAKLLRTEEEREKCLAMAREITTIEQTWIDPQSRLARKITQALARNVI
ncbi:MAG: DUF3141 domain-containing protein [Pseudomonadota bacterium]|nr:DUF3141 domain-containing protein [Pseudomonadota bacterium]